MRKVLLIYQNFTSDCICQWWSNSHGQICRRHDYLWTYNQRWWIGLVQTANWWNCHLVSKQQPPFKCNQNQGTWNKLSKIDFRTKQNNKMPPGKLTVTSSLALTSRTILNGNWNTKWLISWLQNSTNLNWILKLRKQRIYTLNHLRKI